MDHYKNECKDEVFDEKIEPGELLEDCWFFGNLLQRKSRMLRSLSDPCTSSSSYTQGSSSPGKSYEETYESIKKGGEFTPRPNLIKAPSVPSSLERQHNPRANKGISDPQRSSKSSSSKKKSSSSNGLLRAPSLPTSLEKEEQFQDEEIEFSMGKLIRQASLNCSDNLPPKRHTAKGLSKSYSISRHTNRMRRKPELESIKLDGMEETVKLQIPFHQQLKTQKSFADLESEELQGFKDLGFDFDKKELSPNVISIIPGLQENKSNHEDEEKISTGRRPYLSEAWAAQSFAPPPPVPKWGGKKSTEDMKAQIKFWARAVASNVRQEC